MSSFRISAGDLPGDEWIRSSLPSKKAMEIASSGERSETFTVVALVDRR